MHSAQTICELNMSLTMCYLFEMSIIFINIIYLKSHSACLNEFAITDCRCYSLQFVSTDVIINAQILQFVFHYVDCNSDMEIADPDNWVCENTKLFRKMELEFQLSVS